VSTICISVNPFKLLPLYTPDIMDKYRENAKEMPPHVFKVRPSCPLGTVACGATPLSQIADGAYKGMLNERADQSIIISGESGAGKSEATKLMLQYIADISTRAAGIKKSGARA
jgi:myosin heavy subunit